MITITSHIVKVQKEQNHLYCQGVNIRKKMKVISTGVLVYTDYCLQFPLLCKFNLYVLGGWSTESSLPTDPLFCLQLIYSVKDMNKLNSEKKKCMDRLHRTGLCALWF